MCERGKLRAAASAYQYIIHGTQLLLVSQIVQSYIILTANMEDVKKIARKFVSDSLAEKVAEFVARASAQMFADKTEDITDNELKHENLLRQRKITRTTNSDLKERTTKYNEIVRDNGRDSTKPNNKIINEKQKVDYNEPSTLEKIIKSISYAGQTIDWDKDTNEIANDKSYSKESQEKQSDYVHPKIDHKQQKIKYEQPKLDSDRLKHDKQTEVVTEPPNDYDQSKPDYQNPKIAYKPNTAHEKPKITYEKPKIAYEKPKFEFVRPKPHNKQQNEDSLFVKKRKIRRKPKKLIRHHKQIILKELRNPQTVIQKTPKSTFRPTIHSTILYNDALRLGAVKPLHRGHRLTAFDPKEATYQTDSPKETETNQNISSLQGFNIPIALTTEKERKEFDQYDNPFYPKSEFIATSGPVALPKVAMMKPWWEKELLETR